MGWINRMAAEARAAAVSPAHPRDPVLASYFGSGSQTSSGVTVTADSALRVAAVYACVRVLAETIAALPLHVYRRTDRGKDRARDHPLYAVLHARPNRWQTSFEWRESHVAHTSLRGVSYSRIVEDGAGRVTDLIPLHPDRVRPVWLADGNVTWAYQPPSGPVQYYRDEEILKLPGMQTDIYQPLSPIGLHRETIGLTMGRREYQARFFGNSAVPKGGIKLPTMISPEAVKEIRASWIARHQGPENAAQIAILDGGMEWVNIGMTHDDAQFVELEGLSVVEIARIFRVPPHKIADLTRATFSNIEHQAIEFVGDTVLPWVRRWEDRLNLGLLSPSDRAAGTFIGFDLKGLLRGDAAARANFYRALFFLGALSPDDIRELEDMDKLGTPEAKMTFVQSSMVPLDGIKEALAAKASAPAGLPAEPDPDQMRDIIRDILMEERNASTNGHAGH